ncbi:hypothetical protein QZH41_002007 [Actinostola sp. cb2023]|nr:hypothetical protein QZH41_002007 [Actinostola sp. cb2023]
MWPDLLTRREKAQSAFDYRNTYRDLRYDNDGTPARGKGKHVCSYDKVKTEFIMKRNTTTVEKSRVRNCNMPGYKDVMCKETK